MGLAKHLNIEIIHVEKGYALCEMKCTSNHYNKISTVHGGAIFALADTTAGTCANYHGTKMSTANCDFHYFAPIKSDCTLVCEAKEIKYGLNLCVYETIIKIKNNPKNKIFAKGTFTYFNSKIPFNE